MCDSDEVYDENEVVEDIKHSVWDDMPEIGRDANCHEPHEDAVSCNHDLACKFFTERLISIIANHAEED